jgi:asparagine synthase (glutamine-hydrolysing)
MCGIVGIYSKSPISDRGLLARMRDTMAHRGPDDAGLWWSQEGCLGLAHRRLSIIDLSPAGHQPMADPTGRLQIVFNGEIYNYQDLRRELESRRHSFRSQSDTEVLLEAYREWGMDCLQHLNGAFAFCIYDHSKESLFLARDRAGEKPLFYVHGSNRFMFASELKALMADPTLQKKVDLSALEFYLAYGYVPGSQCILEGVRKLPAAHAMQFSRRTHDLKVWRYWQLPPPKDGAAAGIEDLTDELQGLLNDAVRRQMIADVPVGILLSGGVDSSLVTAMAAAVSHGKVRTFTITFPDNAGYDEGPYARTVAKHFGTEHTELVAEPATVELLPLLAMQYDEPMADSSMVPTYMVSKLIRRHCTVALGGDGGDELFGGYQTYNWIFKQALVRNYFPAPLRNVFSAIAGKVLPVGFKGRSYLMGMGGGIAEATACANVFYDSATRKQLVPALHDQPQYPAGKPEQYKVSQCQQDRGLPGMFMSLDFQTYLPDDILVKVDRASMLNSLEVRVPFLDHRIIEFAFSRVPNALRAGHSQRKILLRHLGSRLLPSHLDLQRKQGFAIPLHDWIKGDWGQYMRDVLSDSDGSVFDAKTVDQLWKGQGRGLKNTQRLFALVIFELWRKNYKVKL